MTENKRFHFGYVLGDTGLIDEEAEIKWFIENCCSVSDLKKNWNTVCDKLNELNDENKQLKQQLKLKEEEERVNCRNCSYFVSNPSSDGCLKREDIGYKGTFIDGMDYHYLAENCPYY